MSKTNKVPANVADFSVGEIGNYYGGLSVKVEDGKAYWSIENYSGNTWQQIPDYLYAALARFAKNSK